MTPDLLTALTSGTYWGIVGIALLLIGVTVGLHYEVLQRLNCAIPRSRLPPRRRVLLLIFGILAAHTVEIWIFGVGLHLATLHPAFGSIGGAAHHELLDSIYLSATTYTTVGYGDLVPHGPIRFLLGLEALTGLVLITWSASFTYLEMRRYWKVR
ncbi:MAG: two pore domain potassium channel family protein [Gammaproteobacteria bacterium]|nr:two pore domain potassium channel family protein [Gammaproteobacteria bacterium]